MGLIIEQLGRPGRALPSFIQKAKHHSQCGQHAAFRADGVADGFALVILVDVKQLLGFLLRRTIAFHVSLDDFLAIPHELIGPTVIVLRKRNAYSAFHGSTPGERDVKSV